MTPVYLDHAATTPVDARVAGVMAECLGDPALQGNPASATHGPGLQAHARVEAARAAIAALIGAETREIVITSGATESNNLAIAGVARAARRAQRGAGRQHIVSARTEHRSVLDSLAQLEREGFAVTLLEPDETGRVPPEAVQTALRADTLLVSLMLANNEIGVVNDIAACARFATAAGALIHCDAAQAVGKLPVAVRELGVDFLSFTAHKFYGPKGVGALYVKEAARPRLAPLLLGGGHERGLRSGTLPTHQIVGFAAAAALAHERRATDAAHTRDLATRLERELETIPGIAFNHRPVDGIPGLVNVSFEGVEGESLVTGLPEIAVSTGSACSSATREPSYVLRALGRDPELAQSSLRISLGRYTTVEEVDAAATAIRAEVARLRSLAGEAGMVPGPRIDADSPLATGNSLLGRALNPLARRHFLARARPAEFPDGACPPGVRQGRAGRRADGAQVLIELHISGGTVKIARFNAYGCPHTLAVTSWLCETLQGVGIAAASVGTPADWARKFSVPTEKLGRLLIVEDALRAALEQAREVAPQGLSQGL